MDGTEHNTELFQVSNCKFDESQFVTLELESGKYMRFQADTGAQCNVVPLELYKKATNDHQLANVNPTKTRTTAYGGTTLSVVGTVLLRYDGVTFSVGLIVNLSIVVVLSPFRKKSMSGIKDCDISRQ